MFKNRTIKRVTAVIGAVLTLFLFGGCSTDGGRAGGGDDQVQVAVVQHMDHPSLNEIKETIISTFEELGMDNVEVIEKNANGDMSLLPSIMQSLVSDGVDYIVPIATPTAQAAIAATTTVPIVFSAVSNPVEAGLVSALDQTTGNVTGVSNAIPVEDIIDLARTMQPDLRTLGFVYNTSEINSVTGIEKAKKYCDANGIAYKEATISSTADLQQAAASIAGEIDAFFTPNDNMVASAMQTYLGVANGAGIPIYVGADSMVKDGGLATVGIDYKVLGRQTAEMVKRLIDGQAIAENPVERISEFAKMINMQTAEAVGISIPDGLEDEFQILVQ